MIIHKNTSGACETQSDLGDNLGGGGDLADVEPLSGSGSLPFLLQSGSLPFLLQALSCCQARHANYISAAIPLLKKLPKKPLWEEDEHF